MLRWIAKQLADVFAIPPNKAAADEHRNKVFDQAKRVSDFIGMIVRLAFMFYASSYFGAQVSANLNTLKGFAFGLCWIIALGVSVVFGGQIFAIIYIHHLRDAAVQTNRWIRILMLISALATSGALWFGIVELISALPKPGLKP
jgi:hypothetical protein